MSSSFLKKKVATAPQELGSPSWSGSEGQNRGRDAGARSGGSCRAALQATDVHSRLPAETTKTWSPGKQHGFRMARILQARL